MPVWILADCFWLAVVEQADWSAAAALKHRISWMLVLPPVEPAKPNRSVAGSAPLDAEMLWLVMTYW